MAGLPKLESLYLLNNQDTDLSSLANHPSLTTVDVSHSEIGDITSLKTISTLKSLNVAGTRIPEAQIVELEVALPNCKIIR